ncbi:MAG: gamma carbonic anhydrase family protein [Elusimicrobiales bacterium]|nr:gamma carbonic anhydrase family protein [Elusimicrobiales bacterium]
MKIQKFMSYAPCIDSTAKIHSTAIIIGRVKVEKNVSIWPYVVLRGDVDLIKISENTNIQDLTVIHPNRNKPVIIGKGVTVGHSAVIHGSIIGDNCLIGMNATVIDCEIGENSIIAAGCVITPHTKIPPNSLVAGVPGKILKQIDEKYIEELKKSAEEYITLSKIYEEF